MKLIFIFSEKDGYFIYFMLINPLLLGLESKSILVDFNDPLCCNPQHKTTFQLECAYQFVV